MAAVRADRGVRRAVAALVRGRRSGRARRRAGDAGADLAHAWPLGIPGRDSVRTVGGGDRLHLDRHRVGAVALGHSAFALPLDLRAGLPVAPARPASLGTDRPAVCDRRHRGVVAVQRYRLSVPQSRRASSGVLHHRHGEPRRAGAAAAGAGSSDDILSGDFRRRHGRRPVRRPDCAVGLLLGCRVSDSVGAGDVLPSDRQAQFWMVGSVVLGGRGGDCSGRAGARYRVPLDAAGKGHHRRSDRDRRRRAGIGPADAPSVQGRRRPRARGRDVSALSRRRGAHPDRAELFRRTQNLRYAQRRVPRADERHHSPRRAADRRR